LEKENSELPTAIKPFWSNFSKNDAQRVVRDDMKNRMRQNV
jgi:hypothetical protein